MTWYFRSFTNNDTTTTTTATATTLVLFLTSVALFQHWSFLLSFSSSSSSHRKDNKRNLRRALLTNNYNDKNLKENENEYGYGYYHDHDEGMDDNNDDDNDDEDGHDNFTDSFRIRKLQHRMSFDHSQPQKDHDHFSIATVGTSTTAATTTTKGRGASMMHGPQHEQESNSNVKNLSSAPKPPPIPPRRAFLKSRHSARHPPLGKQYSMDYEARNKNWNHFESEDGLVECSHAPENGSYVWRKLGRPAPNMEYITETVSSLDDTEHTSHRHSKFLQQQQSPRNDESRGGGEEGIGLAISQSTSSSSSSSSRSSGSESFGSSSTSGSGGKSSSSSSSCYDEEPVKCEISSSSSSWWDALFGRVPSEEKTNVINEEPSIPSRTKWRQQQDDGNIENIQSSNNDNGKATHYTKSTRAQFRAARVHYNARIMPDTIVLARHGQSEGNVCELLYATKPDNAMRLTKLGWDQARASGKILRRQILSGSSGFGGQEKIHFIISPYVRAVETFHGLVSAWCDPSEFDHIPDRDERLRAWYSRLLEMGLSWHEDPRIREQDFGN